MQNHAIWCISWPENGSQRRIQCILKQFNMGTAFPGVSPRSDHGLILGPVTIKIKFNCPVSPAGNLQAIGLHRDHLPAVRYKWLAGT